MKKMRKVIKREQGEFGIGSLIIFIAMIIVAALTATLLINTAYRLQEQAQETSNEAIQDVSMGVKIISMGGYRYNATWGTASPYHGRLDWISVKITPIAGSPPINISSMIIEVSDGSVSKVLTFSSSLSFDPNSKPPQYSGDYFGARMIRDMNPTGSGVMTQGDIVEIYFNATGIGLNLEPQTLLSMKIIPKHGVPAKDELITPSTYIYRYVELR